ncbi:MerR family transcriptional regulator [Actinokineospora globicatena]|uniref:MerR family transcriptional regulator n=1 Tax=Actinokineospora globicatena TaxID=103729 RepID=UPI0020A4D151|nr:MerR family transcriptional regulator [Actinokineospora globicatena]MCP2301456.1 MerR HTH family regulatory protein [Actinokineospora globicatena]GLW76904.1 MerR family transcriptional regulator [Actinokineospora globicatena]GLW83737.1 MerR family transcriptional regulator [Actinokineospora globicatena]
MIPGQRETPAGSTGAGGKFDDEHYPAYTIGAAADLLGVTAGFLRSLDEAGFLTPHRSGGGHRRYSQYQLRLAMRVRKLLDEGTGLDAACRIITLENQLQDSERRHDETRAATEHPA